MAKPLQKAGERDIYKGKTKSWQILDDEGFDRKEIEKAQSAIKGPSPDELDIYEERSKAKLQLPINNANVAKWRDDKKAIETVDFDQQMIEADRQKQSEYFIQKNKKPLELEQ